MRRHLLPLLSACFLALAATAHEFWLQPVRFVVSPGSRVYLARMVGQDFKGEAWPGKSGRVEELRHFQPGGQATDLTAAARQSDSLQTTVTLQQPGTHLLALRTNNAFLTLPAAEFTAYLREEGLTAIIDQRQRRRQGELPGREAYRRCAKTLVQAGPVQGTDTTWHQRVGHPLEIISEQNPYSLRPGASLTVRVLVDGRPAEGQAVQVWLKPRNGFPAQHFVLHTNPNGRTLLRFQQPADVLLGTVRMTPHSAAAEADWQSIWTTLTFAFPG